MIVLSERAAEGVCVYGWVGGYFDEWFSVGLRE